MITRFQNIIIADDDPDDIELFKTAVAEVCPGMQVTVTNDGQELLEVLHTKVIPDAVILDLNMPVLNGLDCLRTIRANDKFKTLPVLMLSTSSNNVEKATCLAAGANYYFYKPLHFSGLKEIISMLCGGKKIRGS